MPLDQTRCSILIGLTFIALYLGHALYHRRPADLIHAVIIMTASSGVVSAFILGTLGFFSSREELGILQEQKGNLFVGALALTWVSVTETYSSVMQPRRQAKSPKPN
ncbi:hypothetical protein [Pseudomonas asplenii]|uniref:hypothetical protein n=1 Tax=Pseudomonas asplenii TaxID=53407 RepID=UPI0022344A2B|nr:hypothetical protein [Pseudomonas asplenii]UZE27829.1 hypothetical protein LOY63_21090 [Pseudomonas asplenii]